MALIVATVLPGFLTASLATRIREDFSFENSALGLCVAVFYVVSAVSSNPAGRLLERIGPVRGMRLAAALTALSCLTVALAAQLHRDADGAPWCWRAWPTAWAARPSPRCSSA